jgi:hypothetical protein
MEYIDVKWLHSNLEDPIRLVSELGPGRFETRKLEFFSNGRVGFAAKAGSSQGTRLGERPVPPIAEINVQAEFSGTEITASDFETLWDQYVVEPHLRRDPRIRAAAKVIYDAGRSYGWWPGHHKPYEQLDRIGLEEFNTIVAAALDAADNVQPAAIAGPQLVACSSALKRFNEEYPNSDLANFQVAIRDDLVAYEIIFVPNQPPSSSGVWVGGSTPYGREVHYHVSKTTGEILNTTFGR